MLLLDNYWESDGLLLENTAERERWSDSHCEEPEPGKGVGIKRHDVGQRATTEVGPAALLCVVRLL